MQKYFVKIDRLAAWVLLISVIIYVISGFGMTKGIIDAQLASNLHLRWIGAIGFTAFIIHSFWAIHLALMRHRIWNVWTKIIMSLIYASAIIAVIYVAIFYQRPIYQANDILPIDTATPAPISEVPVAVSSGSTASQATSNAPVASNPASVPAPAVVNPTNTVKTFTASQLATYNGRNGMPAYAAVSGKVYDLSSVFRNGNHEGHQAGTDLTAAFYGQHALDILKKYQVVGIFVAGN